MWGIQLNNNFKLSTKPYNADFDGDKHDSIFSLVSNRER